jgi:molybdopterin molybdotransferase
MLSLDELCNLINQTVVSPLPAQTCALAGAVGRVLATDIIVPFDQPREPLSAMDGYAVRYADLQPGGDGEPVALQVSQRIPAGSLSQPLAAGTVARIFTGAMLPDGADTVVMQEQVTVHENGSVSFNEMPKRGSHVRKPGDELKAGERILTAGTCLNAGVVALLASMGMAEVRVLRKIRVGLLFTGDELRQPGETLQRGQIYNSNRWMWRSLLQRPYIDIEDIGQVADTLDATCAALRQLSHCDLILSSGGVSVGEEDHVRDALQQVGQLQAWKVAMKPGKPIAIGHVRREDGTHALFAGLPGNPVSSFAGFLLLLRPLVWRVASCVASGAAASGVDLAGSSAGAVSVPASGASESAASALHSLMVLQQTRTAAFAWLRPDQRRTEFLRARLGADGRVELHPNQQSAALAAVAWADGFVRIEPGLVVNAGDPVSYLPVSALVLP